MEIQAYTPEYHILGPLSIEGIIVASTGIQLQCIPSKHPILAIMTVPQDRKLSVIVSKDNLFKIMEIIRRPLDLNPVKGELLNDDVLLERASFESFCTDIEDGIQIDEKSPGYIEMLEQYPRFSQIPENCLLVGYRPMGKGDNPYDLEYLKELSFNHNTFLVDKVLEHEFIYHYKPFDYEKEEFTKSRHKDDRLLGLLEVYLFLSGKGHSHEDSLKMSCLNHEWFLRIALEMAKDSDFYEELIDLSNSPALK